MPSLQRTIGVEPAPGSAAIRPLDGAAQWPPRGGGLRPTSALYLSVGLVAGAVVALQIATMHILAAGNWAYVASLVVSLAMLGFGAAGALMCVAKGWFERNWRGAAWLSLLLFGPLTVGTDLLVQQIPFNAALLISDPAQKWRLFATFILYTLPFLAGALFLGIVFLKAQSVFGRVYCADLMGSGLCGLLVLAAVYFLTPENVLVVPLLLWLAGGVSWFVAVGQPRTAAWLGTAAAACAGLHFAAHMLGRTSLRQSDYNGATELASHVETSGLLRAMDHAELLRDEWSRPLGWATLVIACIAALSLALLPLAFGWRAIFSRNPGKVRTIVYFACLGAGYIMVEVGLIAKFTQALSNATVSASVLITGMLVFSGLGSLVSERYLERARTVMPRLFLAIGALLIGYGLALDRVLDWIGAFPDMPAPSVLLRADLPAGVPHGHADAHRHVAAGAARQEPHVPVGVGHQRLLLGGRGGAGAGDRRIVRAHGRAGRQRLHLPAGDRRLLRDIVAARRAVARAASHLT